PGQHPGQQPQERRAAVRRGDSVTHLGSRPRIFCISAASKARAVCVLMLPSDPRCSRAAVAVASSGASQTITPSKAPSVQYRPVTLTPSFSAAASNAAARSQVSRTALMPCSVKCRVVMKVAIVVPSPAKWLAPGGHFIPAARPRRGVATAGSRPGLATPAAFEVGRHPVKGQGSRPVVRDETALAVYSIRPLEVREAVPKALARASRYDDKSDELP